jgi:hypothetical protein
MSSRMAGPGSSSKGKESYKKEGKLKFGMKTIKYSSSLRGGLLSISKCCKSRRNLKRRQKASRYLNRW